jgi:hypothetical protein
MLLTLCEDAEHKMMEQDTGTIRDGWKKETLHTFEAIIRELAVVHTIIFGGFFAKALPSVENLEEHLRERSP